jgi:hypothetical protein
LSFIEFVYNTSMYFTTDHSPFEVVSGFNLLVDESNIDCNKK